MNQIRKDRSAVHVAVMKETDILHVGHVHYNISSILSQFLRRECNKGFAQVTGNCINCGAGYGLHGRTPYPGVNPIDLPKLLEEGMRLEYPTNAASTSEL